MKKIYFLIVALLFVAANIFAQEVRGLETRRVIYEGAEGYSKRWSDGYSKRYYGWEITNRNSFPVNVDIELYHQGSTYSTPMGVTQTPEKLVKTQTIILKSGESYIFKREEHKSTKVHRKRNHPISSYFIKYKAFKFQ